MSGDLEVVLNNLMTAHEAANTTLAIHNESIVALTKLFELHESEIKALRKRIQTLEARKR